MASTVWIPVNASMKGFAAEVIKGSRKAAEDGGKIIEDSFAKSGETAGAALAAGVEKQTRVVATARKAEAQAAKDVAVAEKQLEQLRASGKGTASQMAAAENNVATAKAKHEHATSRVARSESDLEKIRSGSTATAAQVVRTEDLLGKARITAADAAGKAQAADLKVTEKRNAVIAANDRVTASEKKLESARSQYGAESKQVERAEKELERSKKDSERASLALVKAEGDSKKAKVALANATDDVKAKEKLYKATVEDSAQAQKQAAKSAETLGDKIKKTGVSFADAAGKAKLWAAGIGAGLLAMGKEAASYAAEAEQSYGAVESIFEGHAQSIIDASKGAAEAVGVSGHEYRELSAATGAMLKNMGFPMEEVTSKSMDLITVGSDLAATFGGSTKEAMEAIGSLMRGETDPIERYGVSIREADISARLAAQGLDKLEGEALKQAKAQALLALLSEQTASAQGQFARETDTAAHKTQVATAKYNDAKEAIGTNLLPIMAKLADMASKVTSAIAAHPKLFTAIGAGIAALSGVVVVVGTLASGWAILSGAAAAASMTVTAFIGSIAAAAAPILAIVAAVIAVGAALWAFFTKTEIGKAIWESLVNSFKTAWDWIKGVFAAGWDWLSEKIRAFGEAFNGIKSILANGDFIGGIFNIQEDHPFVNFLFNVRDGFITLRDAAREVGAAIKGEGGGISALTELFGGAAAEAIISGITRIRDGMTWLRDLIVGALSGTLSNLWGTLKNLGMAVWELVGAIAGAAWSAIKGFWDLLVGLWNFLSPVLVPVLKTVGLIVGGVIVGAVIAAVKALEGLSWVVNAVSQVVLWLVQNALSPLISVIGQVGGWLLSSLIPAWNALSAGISWGWNNLIKPAWDALVSVAKVALVAIGTVVLAPLLIAWNALSAGISWGWNTLIKPAWDLMVAAANWLWNTALKVVFDNIKLSWNTTATAVKWAWDVLIKPAWDAIAAAASWLWNTVLRVVFDAIRLAWHGMSTSIKLLWDTVIKPTWDAVKNAAQWLWNSILKPVFDAIRIGWHAMSTAIKATWDGVIKPTWDAVKNGAQWLWNNVLKPTFDAIHRGWQAMGTGLKTIADTVIKPMFQGIQSALDTLGGWFDKTVKWIGDTWNTIKEKTAAPIRFVVDTVYNNGIRKAWNAVAKLVGVDELPEHRAAFADGGVFPGYAPGKDTMRFFSPQFGTLDVSPGESFMRPEWTKAVGGEPAVRAMNDVARHQGVTGVRRMLGEGAAFSRGGVLGKKGASAGGKAVDSALDARIAGLFRELKSEHGKPYQYGGTGNPSWDCSGLWSGIVQYLNGGNLRGPRIFNTESNFANFGFERGLKGRVTIGVMNGGGGPNSHMSGTIDGVNIESAGSYGVQIGGQARGSDNSIYNAQYTLAKFLGEFISGGNGGGGGFSIASMVKGLWDAEVSKIGDFPGAASHGLAGKLPAAVVKKLAEAAWNFIREKAGTFSGSAGVAGNAESWREMAMAAMRRQGFNADDPAQVNAMLAQIMSESGGIPGRVQEIHDINGTGESAGVGLLQIIPGTFAAHRDPELPDDRKDPWANMNAALRYYKSRYGTDLTRMWGHGHGYDAGGWLPPTPGGFGTFYNHTGKPEAVLTRDQWALLESMFGDLRNAVPALIELGTRGPDAWKHTAEGLIHTTMTGDYPGYDVVGLHEDHPLVVAALRAHPQIVAAHADAQRYSDAVGYGHEIANQVFWKSLGDKSAEELALDAVFDFFGMGDSLTKKLVTKSHDELFPLPDWYKERTDEESPAAVADTAADAAAAADTAAEVTTKDDESPRQVEVVNPKQETRETTAGSAWDVAKDELVDAFYQGGSMSYSNIAAVTNEEIARKMVGFASASGSFARKMKLYDSGGVLKDGEVGLNDSGKPEAVLTNDEWGVLKKTADGENSGVTVIVNVDGDEVLRRRVDATEKQVEINTSELRKQKEQRREVGAGVTLLS